MQVQYNRNRLMDNVQQKILCYAERYLHSKGTCQVGRLYYFRQHICPCQV